MLIGFSSWTATPTVNGATAVNLPALVDGRPSSIVRVSGGAGVARLRLDWSASQPIRVVAALGLTCPAGTAVKLTGRRSGDAGYAYALGGNSASQQVVAAVDGSRAAWFVLPASNSPLVGVQLELAVGAFDIGELVAHQAADVAIEPGWETDRVDPSILERTLGGSVNVVPRRTYRRLRCTLTAQALAAVRQQGLENNLDWERLAFAASAGGRVTAIPRWGRDAAIDPAEIHRTAIYGLANSGAFSHAGGAFYKSGLWTIEEVPPV